MSYRAITKRITYIDSRLRHRQDYPSAPELARGLAQEHGESVSKRTIERDMDKMRDRGAPIEYDPGRRGGTSCNGAGKFGRIPAPSARGRPAGITVIFR